MRIDGKFRNLEDSDAAFARLKAEFFDPWSEWLELDGIDGVSQIWRDDTLVKFRFPNGFGTMDRLDVSAAQHEMGHFVCVPEAKCIREGFGFGRGIPTFVGNPYDPENRIQVKAVSANAEAKAMAWEVIISRDLHNLDLNYSDIARSLQLTDDFLRYEGTNTRERLDWVTGKIIRYVEEFGTLDNFRALWRDRCSRLPELFRRESVKVALRSAAPVWTTHVRHVVEGWHGIIEQRSSGDIETFTVILRRDDPEDWEFGEGIIDEFDTLAQAERWIAGIREAHDYVPPKIHSM